MWPSVFTRVWQDFRRCEMIWQDALLATRTLHKKPFGMVPLKMPVVTTLTILTSAEHHQHQKPEMVACGNSPCWLRSWSSSTTGIRESGRVATSGRCEDVKMSIRRSDSLRSRPVVEVLDLRRVEPPRHGRAPLRSPWQVESESQRVRESVSDTPTDSGTKVKIVQVLARSRAGWLPSTQGDRKDSLWKLWKDGAKCFFSTLCALIVWTVWAKLRQIEDKSHRSVGISPSTSAVMYSMVLYDFLAFPSTFLQLFFGCK